ncbi:MAG: ribonuclease HI [Minisyncoccia bacterium]|jgi:ribonuclease HI
MAKPSIIVIFTDGASRGNPGPGGWGAVLVADGNKVVELGGGAKETTNNVMELTAAIKALKKTPKGSKVALHTDSSYVMNGITKWIKVWKKGKWKTKAKKDVLNRDLWEELDGLAEAREIDWRRVGGHVGVLGNERCDHIATAFADGMKVKLYRGPLAGYDLPDILDVSGDKSKLTAKRSEASHSRAKAYSYVSMVDGVIEVHHTWEECEKRVKSVAGAKYKKSTDAADESRIIEEFGTF